MAGMEAEARVAAMTAVGMKGVVKAAVLAAEVTTLNTPLASGAFSQALMRPCAWLSDCRTETGYHRSLRSARQYR